MRYTALEKLFIFLFSLILIACFVIFTAFHAEKIKTNFTDSTIINNPYEVIIWLCLLGLLILLYFSIKGVYKGIKNKLKNKFLIFALVINIFYICLFNPFAFYLASTIPSLNNLSLWILLNIIGAIYVFIFMIKILGESTSESDIE